MPQKLTSFKPFQYFSLNATNLQVETSLLAALSSLYYLDRHEPLRFTLQYDETRKTYGYGIGEFKAIYSAYKKQRGAV